MNKHGYTCCLELVGSRDYARRNPEIYKSKIDLFLEQVADSAMGKPALKINSFQHVIMADSSDLIQLLEFVVGLRQSLFTSGLFLRGVFKEGNSFDCSLVDKIKSCPDTINGVVFNSIGAGLMSALENFKGVGVCVDEIVSDIEELGDANFDVIDNCYLPNSNSRIAKCFKDLQISIGEETDDQQLEGCLREEDLIFQIFYKEAYKASTISNSYSRLFLPLFINYSSSYDIHSVVNYKEENRNKNGFIYYLMNSKFERMPKNITGTEYLYFSFVNRIIDNEKKLSNNFVAWVYSKLFSMNKIMSYVDSIPDKILSPNNRDAIYEKIFENASG